MRIQCAIIALILSTCLIGCSNSRTTVSTTPNTVVSEDAISEDAIVPTVSSEEALLTLDIHEGERLDFEPDETVIVGSKVEPGEYYIYIEGSNALLNVTNKEGEDKLLINSMYPDGNGEYEAEGYVMSLEKDDVIFTTNGGKLILVKV